MSNPKRSLGVTGRPVQMDPAVEKFRRLMAKDGHDLKTEWPEPWVVDALVQIALEPSLLVRTPAPVREWWMQYFVKRPGFTLAFMNHIRQEMVKIPAAQHWVNSPAHKAIENEGQLKDDAVAVLIKGITGEKINTRSLETARRKFRQTQRTSR
jgi:hypothetical protein